MECFGVRHLENSLILAVDAHKNTVIGHFKTKRIPNLARICANGGAVRKGKLSVFGTDSKTIEQECSMEIFGFFQKF